MESIPKNEIANENEWEASLERPQEIPPKLVGEYAVTYSKWEMLLRNPSIQKGGKALLRTMANTGISLLDIVPVAGETGSWSADAFKSLAKLRWFRRLNFLTPDVPLAGALATEATEVVGGAMPSHLYETLYQFFKGDKQAIHDAFVSLRETMKLDDETYKAHQEEIDEAVSVFLPEANQVKNND